MNGRHDHSDQRSGQGGGRLSRQAGWGTHPPAKYFKIDDPFARRIALALICGASGSRCVGVASKHLTFTRRASAVPQAARSDGEFRE